MHWSGLQVRRLNSGDITNRYLSLSESQAQAARVSPRLAGVQILLGRSLLSVLPKTAEIEATTAMSTVSMRQIPLTIESPFNSLEGGVTPYHDATFGGYLQAQSSLTPARLC